MKNYTITVNTAHLAAVAVFASRKDIRYYLNGALIEATETETRVAATDGHVLGLHRADSVNGLSGEARVAVIVPNDTLALLAKAMPKGGLVNVCCTDDRWEIVGDTVRLPFSPIEGRFPDYRMVIPMDVTGEAGQFNPDLLARFNKAAKALAQKALPVVDHNGSSAARVTLSGVPGFVGVIMPVRVKPEDRVDTSWARAA